MTSAQENLVDQPLTVDPLARALNNECKSFIVQRLAMFDTPTQVVIAVKEHFGIELTRQGVQYYDPTVGSGPSRRWAAMFDAARTKLIDGLLQIPIANQGVRLRRLERMAVRAEERGNFPLAAQLLEQAAKEVGGFYTNKRELTGKGGTPLMPLPPVPTKIVVQLVRPPV